ncbi:hypothetical protein [Thalassotalea sp. PP2-459]|uniref:hypothetical protein n=1 Tax=Thalassotalea sp. PP2-459 TaxID=1742724 RepID=UPI0009447FEF|nr:hypothetical protein [Thalassotalea sp. PP2-459]OKY27652.1 hypothetical protein BI291_07850 [Thalassotalea sp. PP2-459]
MNWISLKNFNDLPKKASFLIWEKKQEEWLEVSVIEGSIICHFFNDDIEIPLENVSHYCVPRKP